MTVSKENVHVYVKKRLAYCQSCRAEVLSQTAFCPLCGDGLKSVAQRSDEGTPRSFPYPDLSALQSQYNLAMRLGLFFTFLLVGMASILNLTLLRESYWSVIVAAVAAYLWFMVLSLLRRGVNQAKKLTGQVIFTALLVYIIDVMTVYEGWSISYVLPSLFMVGIIGILMMNIFMRSKWQDYIFYQFLMGVLGFIPLVLYFLGWARSIVMVIIVSGFALTSILFTLIFADRSLKEDFIRRFNL